MTDVRGLPLRWRPDDTAFWFDAGTLSLELLTTGAELSWGTYEGLNGQADVAVWAQASRLGVDAVRVDDDGLTKLRSLRTALWNASNDLIAGRTPAKKDLAAINAAAHEAPMVPEIGPASTRQWRRPVTGQQLASTVARDAIELLTGPYADRIRVCEGGNCELVFVDTSRPGRRRWCSMQRCGNRQKIRDFRDRRRDHGADA